MVHKNSDIMIDLTNRSILIKLSECKSEEIEIYYGKRLMKWI